MKQIKKNFVGLIVLSVFCGLLLTAAAPAIAGNIFEQMAGSFKNAVINAYGSDTGYGVDQNTFLNSLISIINYLLTFLGVVFFLIILYAGYIWMLARGNTENVEKAKKMLQEAVIALIIVFFARLLTEFVLTQIGQALA